MSEFFTTLDQLEDAQSQCHCLALSLRDTLRECESDLANLATAPKRPIFPPQATCFITFDRCPGQFYLSLSAAQTART